MPHVGSCRCEQRIDHPAFPGHEDQDRSTGSYDSGVKMTLQRLARTRSLATRHVFTYKGRPLQRVSRSFKTAIVEARITDFRFHDLRPGASTNLRRAGVDPATAMKIVGHKSEKMWKRYDAIEVRDLTQAAQKVHRYLQENRPGTLGKCAAEYSSRK